MASTEWDWDAQSDEGYKWYGYVEATIDSATGLITKDYFDIFWYSLDDFDLDGELSGIWSDSDLTEDFISDYLGYSFLVALYTGQETDGGSPFVMYMNQSFTSTGSIWTDSRPEVDTATGNDDGGWDITLKEYSDEEKAVLKERFDPDDIDDEDSFIEVYDEKIADFIDTVSKMTITSQNTLNFKKVKAIVAEAKNISAFETEEIATATTVVTVSTAMTTTY
jgi:hypothetical protein